MASLPARPRLRIRRLAALVPVWLLLWPGAALGQRCIDDVFCVQTEESRGEVRFFVENQRPDDLTVIFDVDASNAVAEVDFPYSARYPGAQRTYAFTLRQDDGRAAWRYVYRVWWRPATTERENCIEDLFCVVVEEQDAGLDFYVDNRQPFAVSVSVEATFENAAPDVVFPYATTYPATRRTQAFRARRLDPYLGIQYKYTFNYRIGRIEARHDQAAVYALPFAPGKTHRLLQGYNGAFTHQGLHALDFAMDERTPVYAARGGLVVNVVDRHEDGGTDDRFKDKANLILIQHDDGTLGSYVHLARNGTFVRVGQQVTKGQAIGISGNTGYSSGPHLHFEVYTLTPDLERRTIPVRFDLGGRAGGLEEGRAYTAPE